MTWFDIQYGGQTYVENLTGGDEKTLAGLGFHGYATQAEAVAHPNTANALQMLVAANILAGHPAGGVNTTNPPGPTTVTGAGAVAGVTNPLDFLRNIGAFFDRLTEANTWLRVGEFLLGGALLALGISKLFAGTPAGKATGKAIKTGVKVAAL